ncbi:allantoicase [Streptomyces sp. NPDC059740]|uniref:allantoicase n=1 Tax=Streptomyces sp. NPDC059740 TaxID=3346926 RepID=UPI0036579801
MTALTAQLDLASAALGGVVMAANDETCAAKENLLRPEAPAPGAGGPGSDAWATRHRHEPGDDWALVRLGEPGVISTLVVDTSHCGGNSPRTAAVQACTVEGYPGPTALLDPRTPWTTLLPPTPLSADTPNAFDVQDPHRYTHVRLRISPDGAVARLRVHGHVVPDPRLLATGRTDLAAQENGAVVLDHSGNLDPHRPPALTAPGPPTHPGHGWAPPRRRDEGNDWVQLRLVEEGLVRQVEVDTRFCPGTAPAQIALYGMNATTAALHEPGTWFEILPPTAVQPDTRHRYPVSTDRPATHVRLDALPHGGLARLRLWGELTPAGAARVTRHWEQTGPASAQAPAPEAAAAA